MRSTSLFKGLGSLLFAGLAAAAPSLSPSTPAEDLSPRADLVRRANCNTPSNRACWTTSPNFNINTDYEASIPNTGVTRTVSLGARKMPLQPQTPC